MQLFKKTVLFVGTIRENQKIIPEATACLVIIKDVFHLITAKHVVFDKKIETFTDQEKFIFWNDLDGSRNLAPVYVIDIVDLKEVFEGRYLGVDSIAR
ncbi:MAG: hypothetical protein ACRD5J_14690 [Nitrososphaeraceae archaeon]